MLSYKQQFPLRSAGLKIGVGDRGVGERIAMPDLDPELADEQPVEELGWIFQQALGERAQAIALKYADTAAVLENGATVLSGPASDLRARDDIKSFHLGERLAPPDGDGRRDAVAAE